MATTPQDCRIRARLPEPYSAGAWIEVRNSAVHTAQIAAQACCPQPRVAKIKDCLAGFAAWEIRFTRPTSGVGTRPTGAQQSLSE